ncbi:MAG: DUF1330 domain-containing protein [Burkholderiaceae bacterium]
MAAYIIADVKVTDPEQYKQYGALTPAAVAAAGGEFLVRGGQVGVLEGGWDPTRVVVIRFEDMPAAKAFYDSALYTAARAKREGATEYFNMIVVDGI